MSKCNSLMPWLQHPAADMQRQPNTSKLTSSGGQSQCRSEPKYIVDREINICKSIPSLIAEVWLNQSVEFW